MSNKISRYLRDSRGNAFSSDADLQGLSKNSVVKNINSGLSFKKTNNTGTAVFDKLPIEVETDAVLYTAQTLTDAQKLQARTNIGISDISGLPLGSIIIWSGSKSTIPSGWQICDGNNGTPDLRQRFVLGAGGGYAQGTTGGCKDHYHYIGYHTGDNSGAFYVSGELHNDSEHTNGVQNPKAPKTTALLSAFAFNDDTPVYVESEIGAKTAGWNGNGGGGISDHSKLTAGNMITSRGYDAITNATDVNCLPPFYVLYYIMKISGNDSVSGGGTAASATQVENLSNLISQLQARIATLEAGSGNSGGSGSSVGGTFTLGNEFTATLVSEGPHDDPIPAGTIITPNLYTQGDGHTYGGSSQVLGSWKIYQGTGTGGGGNFLSTGSYIVTQQGTVSSETQLGGSAPYYKNIHNLKLRKITGVNV